MNNNNKNNLYAMSQNSIHYIYQFTVFRNICDQAWENWTYLHILYFEKYEFEILDALFFSCGAMKSCQIYRLRKNIGGSNIWRMVENMRLARF